MWSVANEPASEEVDADIYFKPLIVQMVELDPQKCPVTLVTHLRAIPEKD